MITVVHWGDFKYNPSTKTSTDYVYDANGNLTVDNNKNISNIHYNFLNLPDSIYVTGKGYIKYVYDASGMKISKRTVEGSKTTIALYHGGIVYQNDTLQFVKMK